jgi:hypothetical protein
MADYKIQIGTELDTSGIDKKVKGYNGNVEVGSTLDTSGITKTLNAYKAKPLNVNTKLSTKGITEAIKNYKAKKPIKIELDWRGVETAINTKRFETPLAVKVQLNWAGVGGQIAEQSEKIRPIMLNAELNRGAISDAITEFNNEINKAENKTRIRIGVDPNFDGINKKIGSYTPSTLMKINAKVNKGQIDESIKNFKTSSYVKVGVQLKEGAIETAIGKYAQKEVVPVAVDFKVGGTKDIDARIASYKQTPVNVPVKLIPAKDGFSTKIETTPVKVSATVDPADIRSDIETAINGFAPTAKMPVNIKLVQPKDIDAQVRGLVSPTEPINVKVKLDASAINADIALFKPTATLGVYPDLVLENVDDQIRAYVPKAQIKVNVKLDENSINQVTGKQSKQSPVQVNVKLDTKSINEQLKGFTTKTQIKVGVKLDVQKISEQIKNIKTGSPIRLNVELNARNVRNQINDIRRQLQELGNVRINLGGAGGAGGAGGGAGGAGRGARRQAEETVRAYRELASIQDRINTKQQSIARLDTSKNAKEILELSNQIARLNQRYQELYSTFSGDFNATQIDNLNRKFEILNEKLNLVNRKSADAQTNLANSIRSGNFASYDAEVQVLTEKFAKLSVETTETKAAIDRVKQALLDMKNAPNDNALIEAEQRYQEELRETEALRRRLASIENADYYESNVATKKEAALARLQGLFENGSQASKRFGEEARMLETELNNVGRSGAGIDVVNGKIAALEKRVKNSGLQVKKLGTRLKEQFSKYSTYLSGYMVFMYATRALRDMFQQVKAIDSAMTELKKVTNETDASYNRFLRNAASRAKEIGTTIDGLVASTADFARLGYNFKDAQGLAEVANIYAVVGDEVEGVEGATESLISTMAAFKDEMNGMSNSDFAMSIIDKFNEVGNNFAISSGGIGEAMERSASSLMAANNTLDESIALITAANTVVNLCHAA